MLSPHSRLGPYEILEPLGSGGMGEVYRARDSRLDRDVAVKVLPPQLAAELDLRLRFEREAKAVAALSHPHICAIFDVGFEGGHQFLVMELLNGETLADRMARGLLPLESSIECGTQIADALAEAHRQGIVHRDLKPSNVMLVRTGAKLLDFGVARFHTPPTRIDGSVSTKLPDTARGVLLGTLQYMSPEQLQGHDVDGRADLFSLGVLLYEMTTGVAPFAAESKAAIIAAILDRRPPSASSFNAGIPAALDRLIDECLEKRQQHRPTATDVAHRLRAMTVDPHGRTIAHARRSRSKIVRSLAVLPFSAVLRNEGGDVFGDGMAEGLISCLGSYGSLRVISLASARRYRASTKTPSAIGGELRVDAVLRGRVEESPEGELRLTVSLTDTTHDERVWSGEFRCERADVLNIEEQIAEAVATHIRLSANARGRRRRRLNAESHEAYLRGKFHFDNRLGNWLESSFDALTAAITHDRTFAPPHATLCRWYTVAALRQAAGVDISPYHVEWREGCRKAEGEARLALRLDPLLADAHSALARVLALRWNFDESESAYRRSLELDSGHAVAHSGYSLLLSITNRHADAIQHAEIARDHDPLATYVYEQLAFALFNARQFDACLEACQRGLELNPGDAVIEYFRGLALGMLERFEPAAESLRAACARMPTSPFLQSALASVLIRSGVSDAASEILSELEREHRDPVSLAEIYAAMGRDQDALAQLEAAFQQESPQILGVFSDPRFISLTPHPRFRRLLHAVGLSRFFESSTGALL